jgi:hypothetical protein
MNLSARIRLLTAVIAIAVSSAWMSADDPPQYSDWGPPENLGPVINTAEFELGAAISKDGLSLYFTAGPSLTETDIYVSQRASEDDAWGTPLNLGPAINTPSQEAAPAFSPDGHLLFFHSVRPDGLGGADLYVARRHNKRDDFGWGLPVNLGPLVNSASNDTQPVLFDDKTAGVIMMYFTSNRPGGLGNTDIYASESQLDDSFGPAVLVAELSSATGDQGPAIRRDGLEMIFTSGRQPQLGFQDLFVSTRTHTSDPWGIPANLGAVVNSNMTDGKANLSFDGLTLYITSPRAGGYGQWDLWVTTRTKLKGR